MVNAVTEHLVADGQHHFQNDLAAVAGIEHSLGIGIVYPATLGHDFAGEVTQRLDPRVGERRAVAQRR